LKLVNNGQIPEIKNILMNSEKFEIIPEYRLKKYFKYFLFSIGLILIVTPFLIKNYEVLYFIGFIFIISGLLFTLFNSKQYMRINQDLIEFESRSNVKEFDNKIIIHFDEIKEVYFLKRQFLILGGRDPHADIDAQTLYNDNRIVFYLRNQKCKTITQTGKLEDFKKAYSIIKMQTRIIYIIIKY